MMTYIKLFFILILASCGKSDVKPYTGPSNVLNNWSGSYERPSFAGSKINQLESASRYLICNGSYQNNLFPVTPGGYPIQPYGGVNDPYRGNYSPNATNPYDPYYDEYNRNYKKLQETRYTGSSSIPRGKMTISASNENEGYISFGELPYVGASNPNCFLLSGQTLTYEVAGSRLLVCFKSPNENICFDYSQQF